MNLSILLFFNLVFIQNGILRWSELNPNLYEFNWSSGIIMHCLNANKSFKQLAQLKLNLKVRYF